MLENIAYCPVLHTRLAEIKALLQLPAATKDRLFPLFVARPWQNAKELGRTWEKIEEAFGPRRFALDLDRSRYGSGSDKPAVIEFATLFDGTDGFANYYGMVAASPRAIPVLRIVGAEAPSLDRQAEHIEALDRGVVCRFEFGTGTAALPLVDQVLARFPDLSIFVDTGWTRDLLAREQWASQVIQRVTDVHPETEIVVTGSSFPDSFSDVAARAVCDLRERTLFSNLVRRHNAATLFYGDWGSTRPTPDPAPMKIIPRIDLPKRDNWIFFRQDKSRFTKESYADIATRMLTDPSWPDGLNIWGTYVIECTAENVPGGIRNPAVAAAARINIHLHEQAFFGYNDVISDGDEPYTDD
jgi:hypothetical protein